MRARPQARVVDGVMAKAGAAKLLASNDDEGKTTTTFARSVLGANGAPGGIYDRPARSITLIQGSAADQLLKRYGELYPQQGTSAAELVEALRQQRPARISLIGHTDTRGTDAYNLRLSLERAQRVAQYVTRYAKFNVDERISARDGWIPVALPPLRSGVRSVLRRIQGSRNQSYFKVLAEVTRTARSAIAP